MNFHFLPRRLFHALKIRVRPLSVGVRCLIEDEAGRVLLIRHTYVPGWHFPGGGVEPGETSQAALAREIREEACLELIGHPQLVGVYLNVQFSRRDHVLLYRCKQWRRLTEFKPTLEIAEIGFFDLADLPAGVSRGTSRRLSELFAGEPPSSNW